MESGVNGCTSNMQPSVRKETGYLSSALVKHHKNFCACLIFLIISFMYCHGSKQFHVLKQTPDLLCLELYTFTFLVLVSESSGCFNLGSYLSKLYRTDNFPLNETQYTLPHTQDFNLTKRTRLNQTKHDKVNKHGFDGHIGKKKIKKLMKTFQENQKQLKS